jgi:hypothetical protein
VRACVCAQAEKRLAAFRDCLQYFQQLHSKLFEFESKQLMDQINLLDIQIQMEVSRPVLPTSTTAL